MSAFCSSIFLVSALVLQPAPAQPAASVPAGVTEVSINTVFEKDIKGRLKAVENGKLVLEGAPVPEVALDEVARLELDYPQTLSVEWLGQDNRDLVQVGSAKTPNGIQDMHLRLRGLPYRRTFKQILVACRFPGQVRVWRLDPTNTPHWRIAMEKEPISNTADLFLEPNSIDAHNQTFTLVVTFDDGSTSRLSTKATNHTSDTLKVGALNQAMGPAAPRTASVYLEGGDLLRGELLSVGEETFELKTMWAEKLRIPSLTLSAVVFDAGPSEAREQLTSRLAAGAKEDFVLALGRDQGLSPIVGAVQTLTDGKLSVMFEGKERSIQQNRLVGFVLAARPTRPTDAASYQVFQLASGERLSGKWESIDDKGLQVATRWGQSLSLPRTLVRSVTTRNGKLVYLSDLQPVQVDEIPYFSRKFSYRRDQSLFGQPLSIGKKQYAKGLAVHSKCELTYELDGTYETFKSVVGFDPSSEGRGRVGCRILADGKEVFARGDVRATGEPLPVEARIAGAHSLTLEINFGQEEDIGDRVIWADARILRGGS